MFVRHNGAELYTVSFGNGPRTLVAIGGWIGNWELWAEPFAVLSRGWRTLAFDHRGAGATVALPESITLPAMVDDLFAVIDACGVETCVLAAESSGVAVALMAALRAPVRFTGLVLVDGFYYQPPGGNPLLASLQRDYAGTLDWFALQCVPEPEQRAVRHWGRQILARATPEAATQLLVCLEGLDLRQQVARISQHTLVVHGDADRIVPFQSSEWLAAQLPYSTLERIPGAGHVPTMTHGPLIATAIDRVFSE